MPEQKRVSMRDLAHEAEVSVMTVSLSLRNQPGVSEETRKRIQKLAREKGYRPDPALSALISYRRNKSSQSHIGAVAFLNFHRIHESPHYYVNEMFEGASRKAQEMGYKVYKFDGPTDPAEAVRLKRILLSRGIRGIILGPIADKLPVFDWQDFSVVCLGVSFARRQFHTISGDTYHGGFLCAAQLLHSGCQRVGVCFAKDQVDKVNQRYTGGAIAYLARKSEGTVLLPPLYYQKFSPEIFMDWYRKHRPDGIVTGDPNVMSLLRETGTKIPDEVSVASPFDSQEATYINQLFPDWGVWAMNTLAGLIKNNEVGIPDSPVEILIRGRLVHQGSTKGQALTYDQELDAHLSVSTSPVS